MGEAGIEVEGIAFVEHHFVLADDDFYRAFQHIVELLAGVGVQRERRLLGVAVPPSPGMAPLFIHEIRREAQVRVFLPAVNYDAMAGADDGINVQSRLFPGEQHAEFNMKIRGQLVEHAHREIGLPTLILR